MARITAVLVLVCACAGMAAAASAAAPSYVESLMAMEQLEDIVTKHLLSMDGAIPPVSNYKRHYTVIIAHLGEFEKWLSGTCLVNYEKDYVTALEQNIPLAFMKPQYIVDQVKFYLSSSKNFTQKLTRLIKSGCADQEPASACNVVIHSNVIGDPKRYEEDAELLLLLGDMASLFLKESDAMVNSSKDYLAVPYLVKNMNNLRDLIFAADDVIKTLNKKNC